MSISQGSQIRSSTNKIRFHIFLGPADDYDSTGASKERPLGANQARVPGRQRGGKPSTKSVAAILRVILRFVFVILRFGRGRRVVSSEGFEVRIFASFCKKE